jgi:phosphoadenosine phosphosulfate reductase
MISLSQQLANLYIIPRLHAIRASVQGPIVFTTSLGLEDQVLTHLIIESGITVEFATLDTGRLFPQTYALWHQTESRYGIRIRAFYPQSAALEALVERQGIDGFYASLEARKACCNIRKVAPLGRALSGASGWITGLRADQSTARGDTPFAETNAQYGLVKFNPLLDWSRERAAQFADTNAIPVSALHDKGFLSIGCAPCTRAVQPGEPERAGRWWWEDEAKKECGLHIGPDGRLQPKATAEPLRQKETLAREVLA